METINMRNTIPHPGEYLLEEIEARGWSQRDLAYILGCPEQSINIIIAGKRGISPEMAKALAEVFDIPAEFFANLQKAFDLCVLSECGVRYVVVESLPRGKIDGVCFWLDKNSPVIGMSLRFDKIDNFWFVLRHEIEHVLQKHGQVSTIIDELEGEKAGSSDNLPEEERIANRAAA